MRRLALAAILLAGLLAAGDKKYSLKEILDPQETDFALSAYTWADWEKLDAATRLRAQGTDPSEWELPPPDEETPEEKAKREENEKRAKERPPEDRAPGFRFDRRLELKKKAFEDLLGAASAPKLEGLIKQLKLLDKTLERFERVLDEAREDYFQVAEQYRKAQEAYSENYKKKHGVLPETVPMSASLIADYNGKSVRFQHLVATRQSEMQFQDWLLGRIGELVAALTDAEADKPLSALAAGLKDSEFAYRIRCAELLARLKGEKAAALYGQALAQEEDPLVLAELIRLKAKWGGPGAFDLLAARLDDPAWPVRAAVIRELSRIPRKESVDLLVARLAKEDGRLKEDIAEALRALTGQNFVAEPEPWRIWWEKNRGNWAPPVERTKGDAPGEGQEAGVVYFYGIRTTSKRVVFCLDISGSMEWSLAGRDEKGPPRLDKAKEELLRALNTLPEDARFAIVVYSTDVATWKKSLEPASPKNKAAARKFVEDLKPEGATDIFDALVTAMEIAAPPAKGRDPGADTIFFMTDGQPTHGKIIDPHQILDEITRRNHVLGVTIHTVGVSKEQNAAFLLNLAKRNGGRYVAYK
ncbi:MAG TPA: VWA domain-containing protein [Planctomycetota bacterium]|nr:VWA domain-containing protein [Planctomycetota bacterium]